MVAVEILIPREGGYAKWERSLPVSRAEANTMLLEARAIGYQARLVELPKEPRRAT